MHKNNTAAKTRKSQPVVWRTCVCVAVAPRLECASAGVLGLGQWAFSQVERGNLAVNLFSLGINSIPTLRTKDDNQLCRFRKIVVRPDCAIFVHDSCNAGFNHVFVPDVDERACSSSAIL